MLNDLRSIIAANLLALAMKAAPKHERASLAQAIGDHFKRLR